MRLRYTILIIFFLICGLRKADCALTQSTALDTYFQDFTNFTSGVTISGKDYWNIFSGLEDDAIAQSSVTPTGTGNSVKLIGALNIPIIDRPYVYGGLTPTWIRYRVRPAISGQTPSVPLKGIGAVCFDFTGQLLAADGASWVDTGATYTIGQWYDVSMKMDFSKHTYDLYYTSTSVPSTDFTPLKTNLKFIDPTINSLNDLKFYGAYSAFEESKAYFDDVEVSYIYRLEIITPSQKLMKGQASGPITLQLQASNSSPQTTVSDMTLELKSTSGRGSFSLSREQWLNEEQITLPASAQEITFYYKDAVAGKPIINVSEFPDRGYLDALQEFEIVDKSARFDVEVTSPQVAGKSFEIKITAKDEKGALDEYYSGSLNLSADYISPSKGKFSISPDSVSGFVRGVLKVNATYPDCGLVTIRVADSEDSTQEGASTQILFLPASFTVSADESSQIVSKPFKFNITAKNIQGATAPNYNGTVNLSPVAAVTTPVDTSQAPLSPPAITESISKAPLSPSSIAGDNFTNGVAKTDLSYNLYGAIKIKAEDSVDNTKSGISEKIEFSPKSISISVTPPASKERDFFYIEEPIEVVVKVLDALDNPIPNYPGVVELTSSLGLTLPNPYTFTIADAGKHAFSITATQPDNYTVVARVQKGTLSAESSKIKVKNATIQVIDTTSPVGTGQVTIQIVDDTGNVITSENKLPITIQAIEDSDNNSVSLPSNSGMFSNGKITIPVSDSEAETVTIVVTSPYKIKIKKGTITFGRAGKTGINQLMWRELKKK